MRRYRTSGFGVTEDEICAFVASYLACLSRPQGRQVCDVFFIPRPTSSSCLSKRGYGAGGNPGVTWISTKAEPVAPSSSVTVRVTV